MSSDHSVIGYSSLIRHSGFVIRVSRVANATSRDRTYAGAGGACRMAGDVEAFAVGVHWAGGAVDRCAVSVGEAPAERGGVLAPDQRALDEPGEPVPDVDRRVRGGDV